ncbi:MAG: helix-turn-helix transcriptional regulator [Lachnospiraceae bacterium]|nr:helix-turn-helix transcriptional regulator [Lachnospiraceae bacterium]
MTDSKVIIGKRIRELRITHKLTQAQFAELIDISVNFLSEIENGKKGMSQDTIYKLCSKLSISADYILFGGKTSTDNISSSAIIEYANNLDSNELEILSNYFSSLINLRKNIDS